MNTNNNLNLQNETKSPRKLFERRFSILVGMQAIVLTVLLTAILNSSREKPAVDPSKYREVASRLQAAGLLKEAITNYEHYLNSAYEDGEVKSSVSFSLGGLYESLNQFEKALSWYYMVELFDPNSRYISKASKKIVSLLEKLGKVAASKRELKKATSLEEPESQAKGSLVLAQIGDKNLYLHDLDKAIDQLPPQMKEKFKSKEEKVNLLRKLVADEVLSQKAVRLGIDQKLEFKEKLDQIKKQFLVDKMLESELKEKIKADESDLFNYFEANKDKYTQKERAQVSLIKVKSKDLANTILSKLKSGQSFSELAKNHSVDESTNGSGGKYSGFITKESQFLGYPKDVSNTILNTNVTKWTKPILSAGHYTIFLVRSKEKEKKPTYNDVKSRIEFDYQMEKTQKRYQELIEESIAGDNIKFFTERIK